MRCNLVSRTVESELSNVELVIRITYSSYQGISVTLLAVEGATLVPAAKSWIGLQHPLLLEIFQCRCLVLHALTLRDTMIQCNTHRCVSWILIHAVLNAPKCARSIEWCKWITLHQTPGQPFLWYNLGKRTFKEKTSAFERKPTFARAGEKNASFDKMNSPIEDGASQKGQYSGDYGRGRVVTCQALFKCSLHFSHENS